MILFKQTLIKKSVISEGGTVKTSRILSTFIKYQCHHPFIFNIPDWCFRAWVLFVVIHWNKQVFFWCIYKSNLPSEHFAALSTRFFLFWSMQFCLLHYCYYFRGSSHKFEKEFNQFFCWSDTKIPLNISKYHGDAGPSSFHILSPEKFWHLMATHHTNL